MQNPEKIEIEGLKTIHKLCKFGADHNMEGCSFTEIVEHMFNELAKAQAVPEGFVLVPKLLSDELADELAIDAFNNIQSMFDYEHRGSTATHREEIRLRWCKNKARDFQENYKAMIEAQEQKG
ncbi:hypothetical protein ACVBEE_01515 [Acinetobacter sp. ANC 3781]